MAASRFPGGPTGALACRNRLSGRLDENVLACACDSCLARAASRQGLCLLMSQYLLPCACGQQISVSAAQAGESLRCSCGAIVEVPTMRGLRDLERLEPKEPVPGDRWGDRQRLALGLLVAALVLWGAAGYLFAKIPASLPPFDPNMPDPLSQNSTAAQAFDVYHEMQRGLHATPP